jgi:hypothetical protein
MQVTEEQARTKFCPMARGASNAGPPGTVGGHLCVGNDCMAWRDYQITHVHGGASAEKHGYCGMAGRPGVLA